MHSRDEYAMRALARVRARRTRRAPHRIRRGSSVMIQRALNALAVIFAALCVASAHAAHANGPSYPPFIAAVVPPATFATETSTVEVIGLNFLPGGDAACSDCNAAPVTTTKCAFGATRAVGTTAVFTSSDPVKFACDVGATTESATIGFARGSWSVNGGYDWATYGGERDAGELGVVNFMATPIVDAVIGAVGAMGIPSYVSGSNFVGGRVACYFDSKDSTGAYVERVVGTFAEASTENGMFISSALIRCENPVHVLTSTPTQATLARLSVGILGGDGSGTSNTVSFKDNYWLSPGTATISASAYGYGGEIVSVALTTSDGDVASIGCLIGTTRVSARSVATGGVTCVAPARVAQAIANVPVLIGVRHSEAFASLITQSTQTTIYTQVSPIESLAYEVLSDSVVMLGRGGQVLTLSSTEDFACALTYVVNNVTSVVKSTVANPSPFVDTIYCSLPMDVFGGFVVLGVTGGAYENQVQLMYADPPRALSASPRRSPSGGGGIVWVYGTNLDSGADPRLTCVFSADETLSVVVSVDHGARVSSALIACELPPASSVIVSNNQRMAMVAVSMRDTSTTTDALDSGASIEYAVNVLSSTISPVRGSIDGGTPVRLGPTMSWVVSGSNTGTPDTDDFGTGGCRFSAVTVSARVADTGAIECVSPSMGNVPIDVPVAIVVDWRTSSAPLVLSSTLTFMQYSYTRF